MLLVKRGNAIFSLLFFSFIHLSVVVANTIEGKYRYSNCSELLDGSNDLSLPITISLINDLEDGQLSSWYDWSPGANVYWKIEYHGTPFGLHQKLRFQYARTALEWWSDLSHLALTETISLLVSTQFTIKQQTARLIAIECTTQPMVSSSLHQTGLYLPSIN